jgi:hypothetical protein
MSKCLGRGRVTIPADAARTSDNLVQLYNGRCFPEDLYMLSVKAESDKVVSVLVSREPSWGPLERSVESIFQEHFDVYDYQVFSPEGVVN